VDSVYRVFATTTPFQNYQFFFVYYKCIPFYDGAQRPAMRLTQEWLYRPRDVDLRFAQVDALRLLVGWLKELSQRQTSFNFSQWYDSCIEKIKCSHINVCGQEAIDTYVWVRHWISDCLVAHSKMRLNEKAVQGLTTNTIQTGCATLHNSCTIVIKLNL
jgi:hypothetical protein